MSKTQTTGVTRGKENVSLRHFILKQLGPIIVIVVLAMVPAITRDPFIMFVLTGIFIWTVMTLALFINMGTGIFNFAPAAFMAVGSFTTAILVTKYGLSFWGTLPVAALLGIVVAILIGLPVLRVKGMYFILVTALFSQVMMLVLATFPGLTGGWKGIANIPSPHFFGISLSNKVAFYYIVLVFLAISFTICFRLWRSQVGKVYRYIGANPTLAQSVGVSLTTYKVQSFAITGAIFALCGCFLAVHTKYIDPRMFDFFTGLDPWFYLVLGGAQSIYGPFIGTVAIRLLREAFAFEPQLAPIFVGAVVIIIVMFLPRGIAGLPDRIKQLMSRKKITAGS